MITTLLQKDRELTSKNGTIDAGGFKQYIKKRLVSCGLSKIDPVWELIVTSIISDAYNAGYTQGMRDSTQKFSDLNFE